VDGDRAAQRLDPVGQADEPGAPADLRPAGAVVAHQQAQPVGGGACLDLDGRGTGVLGRVGQRFGDDVVGGDLDRLGQPLRHGHLQLHRNGGAARQRLQRRAQAALRQDRRVDAARELAKVLHRGAEVGGELVQLGPQALLPGRHAGLDGPDLQAQRDELLLDAVVQVPLDAAAGVVGGGHHPRPRRGQLRAALLEGGRHAVEGALQRPDLAHPAGGHACPEVTAGQPARHRRGAQHRPHDRPLEVAGEPHDQRDRPAEPHRRRHHRPSGRPVRALLPLGRQALLGGDELVELCADGVHAARAVQGDLHRSGRRRVAADGLDQRDRVVAEAGRRGGGHLPRLLPLHPAVHLLRQAAAHRRQGRLGVPPRRQESLLPGDRVAAHARLQVHHQPLELVGSDQHLLGAGGPPLLGAKLDDRDQQRREGRANHQREQAAGDHHASGQSTTHAESPLRQPRPAGRHADPRAGGRRVPGG
jgi:hypothetical protein